MGRKFLFTNRHAYLRTAEYFDDLSRLDRIDWPLLRSRNFQRNPDDPDKFARYEAEALVHQHLPIDALLGIACYNMATKAQIDQQSMERQISQLGRANVGPPVTNAHTVCRLLLEKTKIY